MSPVATARRRGIEAAARIADRAAGERVLVFGSVPPEGRDLDLLARGAGRARIAAALQAKGFTRRGDEWVRFASCGAESVEVIPAGRWHLPPAEEASLFGEARPLPGARHLVRPAPAHALLILARRLVAGQGGIDERRLARVADALREDRDAWMPARERAPAWGAGRALALLHRADRGGPRPTTSERAAALAEGFRAAGSGPAVAAIRAAGAVAPRRRRGRVIALSGLDGSGKSAQASGLRDALAALGHDPVVAWTRLAQDPGLDRVALPVKRAVAAMTRARGRAGAPGSSDLRASWTQADPGGDVRGPRFVLSWTWALFVALRNGTAQRRATRPNVRAGRVVICDRYLLDSEVHLRDRYGRSRRFAVAMWAIRRLSPRPLRAFFLDVPPEVALTRKPDDWTIPELARQAELYREDAARLGVRRLDGTRPPEELCAEIAREVWLALG